MLRTAFLVAGASLAVFTANVTLGALRRPVFLSDVQEMLVLFGAVLAFVIAVLAIERRQGERQLGRQRID